MQGYLLILDYFKNRTILGFYGKGESFSLPVKTDRDFSVNFYENSTKTRD